MVKAASSMAMPKKRWPLLMLVALFSLSTVTVLFIRTSTSSDPCTHRLQHFAPPQPPIRSSLSQPSPLDFMKSKLVLMVSHELSLSGGPLLLMELAFLLRAVGSDVVWITNQMPPQPDDIIYSLENKMLDRGVQVILVLRFNLESFRIIAFACSKCTFNCQVHTTHTLVRWKF
jgi:hypothetical protein